MPRKRKLFLAHAGELSHRLVRGLMRDGEVAQFIRSYADRHNRKKLVADPERLRQLESTIGREALLVAVVEVRRHLPRLFGAGKTPRPEEIALGDAFYAEFLASLGRALEWPPADAAAEAEAFRRDLEIYERWTRRPASAGSGPAGAGQSPFADRCAILLDPAMMEQARRAAAAFEAEAVRTGARLLRQLGRGAERAPRKPSRTRRKSAAHRRKR